MAKVKPPKDCVATYKIPGQDPIYVDPEFQGLIPEHGKGELEQLEANLVRDKRAIDPIVVWQEPRIVMDGHHRLPICLKHKLKHHVVFMRFPLTPEGRAEALEWMALHQEGRRNLNEQGKAKLAQWRRDRVAAMREEGMSTRAIADKEGISKTQVQRDLAKASGPGVPVEPATGKVKGLDGIERPLLSRAARVGQAPVPTFVPKGERMAGDDTEQIKKDKQEAKTDPKNGQIVYDWSAFNREFANFILHVDKLGKVYKKHNSTEAQELRTELLNWKTHFRKWGATISGKTPTPDVVDRVMASKGKKGQS